MADGEGDNLQNLRCHGLGPVPQMCQKRHQTVMDAKAPRATPVSHCERSVTHAYKHRPAATRSADMARPATEPSCTAGSTRSSRRPALTLPAGGGGVVADNRSRVRGLAYNPRPPFETTGRSGPAARRPPMGTAGFIEGDVHRLATDRDLRDGRTPNEIHDGHPSLRAQATNARRRCSSTATPSGSRPVAISATTRYERTGATSTRPAAPSPNSAAPNALESTPSAPTSDRSPKAKSITKASRPCHPHAHDP
jgi:hypothetical protein